MRTVEWHEGKVRMIDQRKLPWELDLVSLHDHAAVAEAIKNMTVRGAPAIGAAAAFGLALAAFESKAKGRAELEADARQAASQLKSARPTAVNLAWAVDQVLAVFSDANLGSVKDIRQRMLAEAQKIADDDVEVNKRMAAFGAALIKDGDTILHHCNTGALAAVDWGTALGVVRAAHEQGKKIHVLLDETRPRLQGARLSAWELDQYGIPFEVIVDGAAGSFLHSGEVDVVLVGSDRTAANGDVANKIGTYALAVLAKENGVPFYPVVPTSTIDLILASGAQIPIEQRSAEEVRAPYGQAIFPDNYAVRNPAFDVTPAKYVTGIVTEFGIAYPPFTESLKLAVSRTFLQQPV
ncbi:MAG: S-methyl-5-thioribose-1-phosphate isomerase [Anaerolineales bacterium]